MDQEADSHHPRGRDERQDAVDANRHVGVERMKADAAPVRVIDRRGQQMVEVNDHGQQHNQPRPSPAVGKSQPGDRAGNEDMEDEVGGWGGS